MPRLQPCLKCTRCRHLLVDSGAPLVQQSFRTMEPEGAVLGFFREETASMLPASGVILLTTKQATPTTWMAVWKRRRTSTTRTMRSITTMEGKGEGDLLSFTELGKEGTSAATAVPTHPALLVAVAVGAAARALGGPRRKGGAAGARGLLEPFWRRDSGLTSTQGLAAAELLAMESTTAAMAAALVERMRTRPTRVMRAAASHDQQQLLQGALSGHG